MEATTRGQVTGSAAEGYEALLVPALFQAWAPRIVDAAGLSPGERVLDVACGTGVLAREAATRVSPAGSVVGLDCNDGMLDVARHTSPNIDWRLGQAEALPFEDDSFDAVLSQFGLMFFEDRVSALREMRRVLDAGGNLAVAVWDSLDNTPGYAALTGLLQSLFGDHVAEGLRSPYALGNPEELLSLFVAAGISNAQVRTEKGLARYPSIEAWVHTDVTAWTISDLIDDAQYELLLKTAQKQLKPFEKSDGRVEFLAPAHIVTVTNM